MSASSMFMTSAELVELTGRSLKGGQQKWLESNRIPFFLNAAGHPRVARAAVLARLGAPVAGQVEETASRQRPNFGALKSRKGA